MIDILYVAFNRLEMTRASLAALVENTDWDQVGGLYIHDDGSTDGTNEYLHAAVHAMPVPTVFCCQGGQTRGPVAVMNWYLDQQTEADRFAKIDNDFVVCPGWLEELQRLMYLNPGIDILGAEPMFGPPAAPPDLTRRITEARHIGGKGIIRKRAFETCRPSPSGYNGYHGFTEWQTLHPQILKAWCTPDLPCFGLDQLPLEPWRSLTSEYERQGWQRRWPEYDQHAGGYWEWWLEQTAVAA